jgi:predicted PurR-regulated permease PerM
MDAPGEEGRRFFSFGRMSRADRHVERLVVRSSVLVLLVTVVFFLVILLAWRLRALLLLVAVAMFIAALLNPFIRRLQRHHFGRGQAVALTYVILVIAVLGIGYLLVHPVYESAVHFGNDLPNLVKQAQHGRGPVGRLATRFHVASYVEQHAPALEHAITQLGKPALGIGKTVISGVASLATIAFLSLFLLLEVPGIVANLLGLMQPETAKSTRRILDKMMNQVSEFMLGDFLTSVIAGVVVFIGLEVTGVPFASVLAIWLGLVDFLPLVGGLLGGVPAIGVAFLHSVFAGVVMLVLFLVYQQIENHFLNPVIISRTVRLNPLWVLIAVLFGAEIGEAVGATFGAICGAIFAVPVAGAIQVLAGELLAQNRQRREAVAVDD